MNKKKKIGNKGEKIALEYLKRKGYTILHSNYFSQYGEIDIIAVDKPTIVFVEVKTRKNSMKNAFASVSHSKQIKLHKTAQIFLQKNPQYADSFTRFDVIAVILSNAQLAKIEHKKDAFRIY